MKDYIAIQPWQIRSYYEPWQVEYLENDIVRVTDSVDGKICLFRLVGDNSNIEQLIYPTRIMKIPEPIPLAIERHRLTRWRHAKKLSVLYPQVWKQWKDKGLIPLDVLKQVEQNDTPKEE